MRNAVNNLQAVYVARKNITKENIFDICDVPDTDQINKLYSSIKKRSLEESIINFQQLWNMDYSVHDLVRYIVRQAEQTEMFSYEEKLCLMRIGCQLRVADSKGLGNKT